MKHLALVLGLLLCCGACSKKPAAPRRTEPWLASASASSAAVPSAPLDFHFTAESSLRFSVPGRKAKPTGQVPISAGHLRLAAADLKSSTASIDADLTHLSLDADSLPAGLTLSSSPSSVAQQWLELGAEVAPDKREQFALARFELAGIEALSAPALDLDAKRPARVRLTAVGSLLVHGFRAPVRAELALERLPRPAGAPLRLSIRSVTPFVLPLAPHDIVARGPSGRADALQAARSEGSVGRSASITLELIAEADTPADK